MTLIPVTNSLGHISSLSRPFGAPRMHMDENASGGDASGSGAVDSGAVVREGSADLGTNLSISQAARALSAARRKPAAAAAPVETPAESAEDTTATAEPELSDEGNAAPAEEQATGGTEDNVNPPEKAPLPLPRSWTKEQAEHWNALPRSTQEYLTDQASKASAELRRVQNEAAEKTKALTAKEQAAEEARNQYESKIKSVVEVLEKEQLREFPDIRSQADLDKMSSEFSRLTAEAANLWNTDPFAAGQKQSQAAQIQAKLSAWGIHQQKLVAATNELTAAEDRKTKASKDAWVKHKQSENKLAVEKIPDLADKVKGPVLIQRAAERLLELGFTQDELTKLSNGDEKISVYDHRLQQLINSDLRLTELLNAPKAVLAKPVPPVQRPGTPAPRGSAQSERIKTLTSKLNTSGKLSDAVALRIAQNNTSRRAS